MFWKEDTLNGLGQSLAAQCSYCQYQIDGSSSWQNALITEETSTNGTYIIGFYVPSEVSGTITGVRIMGSAGCIGEGTLRAIKRAGNPIFIRVKFRIHEKEEE